MITRFFAKAGHDALDKLDRIGRSALFLLQIIRYLPGLISRPMLTITQLHSVGVRTVIIIMVSGLFVGLVLGLLGYNILVRFGAEQSLGILIGLALVKEMGPVITALLFSGRAGSALTAEIGLMKATEQLSGLEMMAVNPIGRIFAPRFLAGVLALPLLAALFSGVGIAGGYFIGVGLLGVDVGSFWAQMQQQVDFREDVMNGVIKSIVFGFVATWIALFEGYDSVPTAEGVGRATTKSVVNASLAVLGLNFILTALMLGGE